jgi:hypothetical protein
MMGSGKSQRTLLAVGMVVAIGGSSLPAWAQSNPATPKVGAVSQQGYAGAVAQAESGLQRPIKFGNPVYAMETVRTGEGGSTELQFLDDAHLHVGANASVKLDQYSYDPASGTGSGLVEMFVGAYDFVSGKMKSDDKVKLVTPTVTIGLRGTALSINITGDGRTDITVKEGLISLAPCRSGAVATASAGQRVSIDNSCVVTFPDQAQPDQFLPLRRQDWIFKQPFRNPKPQRNHQSYKTG